MYHCSDTFVSVILWTGWLRSWFQFLSGTREFILCSAQTGSGAHSGSYFMSTGGWGTIVMLATHLHLVSRLRTHRSVPPVFIRLHGMVCTELSTGSTYLYHTKYPSIALTCLDSGQQSTSSEIICIGVVFLQQHHQDKGDHCSMTSDCSHLSHLSYTQSFVKGLTQCLFVNTVTSPLPYFTSYRNTHFMIKIIKHSISVASCTTA
jgi:hypothetical protein